MKLWFKIEAFLNAILTKLFAFIKSFALKLTPSKILETLTNLGKKIEHFKSNAKEKVSTSPGVLIEKVKVLKEKVVTYLQKLNEKIQAAVNWLKTYDYKSLSFKKIILIILAFLSPYFGKLKAWYVGLKPTTVLGFVVTGAITSLTAINIISASKDIAEKKEQRNPESKVKQVAQKPKKRPSYYKMDERHFKIFNIHMPVYIRKNRNQLKTVTMDITITSSNRYIKEYFFKNYYKIEDRLNSSIHPIIPALPLVDEGKKIIRKKVKEEINNLVNELGIKGEIEDVRVHSIIAG